MPTAPNHNILVYVLRVVLCDTAAGDGQSRYGLRVSQSGFSAFVLRLVGVAVFPIGDTSIPVSLGQGRQKSLSVFPQSINVVLSF